MDGDLTFESDVELVHRTLDPLPLSHAMPAREALGRLLSDFKGIVQNRDDLVRHNARLHRRIETGTDRDALLGEIKQLKGRWEWLKKQTAPHMAGKCKAQVKAVNERIDYLIEKLGREATIPLLEEFNREKDIHGLKR